MSTPAVLPPLTGWENPDRGVLFVVSGPSGAGKSTLVRAAIARIPGLAFSISATTRAPRPGEAEGKDYLFVTDEQFDAHVRNDAFLEHASVYNYRYGTLKEQVIAALERGQSLVLDIDVQGSRQIRTRMPEAVHLFVLPPSIASLEHRLRARGDDETVVARRMAMANHQLMWSPSYDYIVVNGALDTAHATLQGILLAEMSRTVRRGRALDRVFASG